MASSYSHKPPIEQPAAASAEVIQNITRRILRRIFRLVLFHKHAAALQPDTRLVQPGCGRTWSEACQQRGESPPDALVRFPLA